MSSSWIIAAFELPVPHLLQTRCHTSSTYSVDLSPYFLGQLPLIHNIPMFLYLPAPVRSAFAKLDTQCKRSTAANSSSTINRLHLDNVFRSKRVRVLATSALIIWLLTLTAIHLENGALSRSIGSSDIVASNATHTNTNWSRFAYTQYATNPTYLCSSVMMFELLHRYDSKAERLLMYPSEYLVDGGTENSLVGALLRKAHDEYNVKLKPIKVQRSVNGDRKQNYESFSGKLAVHEINRSAATWTDSLTKLLAFNQTEYERVIHLDSDATVLQVCRSLSLSTSLRLPSRYCVRLLTCL